MAVAWRRNQRPALETQLWHVLEVEGKEYIFKSLFHEDGYELLLVVVGGVSESDGLLLGTVCEERVAGAEVAKRSKVSGWGTLPATYLYTYIEKVTLRGGPAI